MLCPKCAAQLPDTETECPRCGVIFAKLADLKVRTREADLEVRTTSGQLKVRTTERADTEVRAFGLAGLLLGVESAPSTPAVIGRAFFLLFLVTWTISLIRLGISERLNGSFMHLPNLVFHEAGHIVFAPFGRFMTVLGGSLFQVVVPLVCASAFLRQTRDAFGAAVAVWWAGESLIDVAPYIDDARRLQLVLLGGRTGAEVEGHDWEYLLNAMGVSHREHAIATIVYVMGTLTMVAALIWAALVVLTQRRGLRGNGRRV